MKNPGYYADGGNLYLQITKHGSRSWVFRFTIDGRAREMGLGALHTVSLAEAREKARACRKLVAEGLDPIAARDAERSEKKLIAARSKTFAQCAEAYIAAHRAEWKNTKHAAQWENTLRTYAAPIIGDLPVQAVDTAMLLKILQPIWTTKAETAGRLRGRIESILDWATAIKYRAGDNPARWKGQLDHLLAAPGRAKRIQHHSALAFDQIGAFIAELRDQAGLASTALEFTILTAARTGEVIGAQWSEFDLNANVWTVPKSRMKAGREHRVPLCPRAAAIVRELEKNRQNEFVFPGRAGERHMSNMAMLQLLRRMKRTDLTVHGFRSTFRDWAAERTSYPREVCEMALAHAVGDAVEAAYRRGDLFEKRRRLMLEWCRFCDTARQSAKVVAIGRK